MRTALLLCLALGAPPAIAAACPEDYVEECLLGICACVDVELSQGSRYAAGLMLEQWLIDSRYQSIDGARPIPAGIRKHLAPYFDKAVLESARYKIDDLNDLNLANLNLHYGDYVGNRVRAVTLVDVIVFRDAETAADPTVWAHELFHVKQFRDWGVRDFAMRYVRDFREVEDPAYEFQELIPRRPP